MNTKPDIAVTSGQWKNISGILSKYVGEYPVWAFGSRANGTAKPYSDLDLVVISSEPLPVSISAALSDEFTESDLPYKVDILDWASTSESFRQIIEKQKVVVQTGR